MAIDTRIKRASTQNILSPLYAFGVTPSTFDQAERQSVANVYAGILAEAPGGPTGHPAIRRIGRTTMGRGFRGVF